MTVRVALPLAVVLFSCAADSGQDEGEHENEREQDGAALYAQVEAIVTQSCARDVCHGFMVANAHMDLMRAGFRAAVVNVPACEYDRLMRVKPGDPEHSWLMIKLAGPVRFRQYADFIDFAPDPDWHASAQECAGTFEDGAPWFGTRMPPAGTTVITADEVETIGSWIRAGAPGPIAE